MFFTKSEVNFDFFDSNIYHDRVLVAGQRKFYVISGLLSLWSDHFREMFAESSKETTNEEVKLNDVVPEALEEFLRIVYSNNGCSLSLTMLPSLIDLSCRFLAPKILQIVIKCIDSNIYHDEVDKLELLKMACHYDIVDLKELIMQYLKRGTMITKLNLKNIMEVVNEYKLKEFKSWIGAFISQDLTYDNCSHLLDLSVKCDLATLKAEISKKVANWEINKIPQSLVLELIQAAFKHNIQPLKDKLREFIFYSVTCTEHIHVENKEKRFLMAQYSQYSNSITYTASSDTNQQNPLKEKDHEHKITKNLFLETYKEQILTLPNDMLEFVMSSLLSPVE